MKRRILVFLLALCLAAALVPVTAFAGGVYKYLGWQHSLSVCRRNRYCGEPLSDRYRSAARVPCKFGK